MTVTDQLRAAARAEYLLVRTALTSVDKRFIAPLEGRADGFDNVMARVRSVLGDVDDRLSGHAQPSTADTPAPVTTPRPAPETTPEPEAAPEPQAASDSGSAVLNPAEVDQVEELAHDYLETEADQLSGELAENEDLREVQARLRAKHTLQERDEQR